MFYAGKSFTAVPARRNSKQLEKDDKILKSLCGGKKPESLFQSRLVPLSQVPTKPARSQTQAESDAVRLQSLGLSCNEPKPSPPELKETPNKK